MSINNYTAKSEFLQDVSSSGRERPFRQKKINSLKTSESLGRIKKESRAYRILHCGTFLKFAECLSDGFKRLIYANFCRDRMCPMCNWRRSRRLMSDIMKIVHHIEKDENYKYIFLTLTRKRVIGIELNELMDGLYKAFDLLMRRKEVKNVVIGFIRTLEVTYDKEKFITTKKYKNKQKYFDKKGLKVGDKNPEYDTYFPHIHVLIAVKPSYFSGNGGYLSQARWTDLWRESLRLEKDTTVMVNVKAVKKKKINQIDKKSEITQVNAVLETAKYSVKDTDYIVENKKDMDKVVRTIAEALHGRRLIAFGKLFLKAKKELKIQDIESKDADLVSDDIECKDKNCPICGSTLTEGIYNWEYDVLNYIKIKKLSKEGDI